MVNGWCQREEKIQMIWARRVGMMFTLPKHFLLLATAVKYVLSINAQEQVGPKDMNTVQVRGLLVLLWTTRQATHSE